jgi:hypothetical protein
MRECIIRFPYLAAVAFVATGFFLTAARGFATGPTNSDLERFEKLLQFEKAHPIGQGDEVMAGPLPPTPRLANGMIGWESEGVYTMFGCGDPVGWTTGGLPLIAGGIELIPFKSATLLPLQCPAAERKAQR